MNTAIIGGAQGLGFVAPINRAQIANQLIASGKVAHPYLGIQMATLTSISKKPSTVILMCACASI